MILYNDKSDCYGCSACQNSCPKQAISMKPDAEGFLYPSINENCVECGMCMNVCQKDIISDEPFLPRTYACINRDKHIRRKSSSGGVFILLAEAVLQRGGVVCGAVLEPGTLTVRHMVSNRRSDIEKMMGSKYVQSDMGDCYAVIQEYLRQDIPVLFSGTPCQVAGCYRAVGHHARLITCDVLCHGAPSPVIWKDYARDLEAEFGGEIVSASFRSKRRGWHEFGMEIEFNNGKRYYKTLDQDAFLCGFLRDLYLRPSCYTCEYSRVERISDITIGDFWGYDNCAAGIKDDDKGLSAIVVSTAKGMAALNSVALLVQLQQIDMESLVPGNGPLRKPVKCPSARNAFWDDYKAKGYCCIKQKYLMGTQFKGLEKFKRSIIGRMIIKTRNTIRGAIS